MSNNCNIKRSKIKGILFVKKPSRYLIKKYGSDRACKIMIERTLKIKLS